MRANFKRIAIGSSLFFFFAVLFVILCLSIVRLNGKEVESKVRRFESLNKILFFGNVDYICHGTCFCGEEDDRRATTAVKKGITAVFAAASSLLAINLAKRSFDQKCHDAYTEDECPSNRILSVVDGCSCSAKEGEAESTDDTPSLANIDDDKQTTEEFLCRGNCIPNNNGIDRFIKANKALKKIGDQVWDSTDLCVETTRSGSVTIDIADKSFSQQGSEKWVHFKERIAITKFLEEHLGPACRSINPGWKNKAIAMLRFFNNAIPHVCEAPLLGLSTTPAELKLGNIECVRSSDNVVFN